MLTHSSLHLTNLCVWLRACVCVCVTISSVSSRQLNFTTNFTMLEQQGPFHFYIVSFVKTEYSVMLCGPDQHGELRRQTD